MEIYLAGFGQKVRDNMERLTVDEMLECLGEYADHESAKQLIAQLEELKQYKDAEEQGWLLRLPCKVGDTVYVDSAILPIKNMECYEDIDNKIPLYFPARVVSFRFTKRNWMKIAVKAKWLHEWIDVETGPESDYIECEKNFSIPLSMIGKTVFLTREEAVDDDGSTRGNIPKYCSRCGQKLDWSDEE